MKLTLRNLISIIVFLFITCDVFSFHSEDSIFLCHSKLNSIKDPFPPLDEQKKFFEKQIKSIINTINVGLHDSIKIELEYNPYQNIRACYRNYNWLLYNVEYIINIREVAKNSWTLSAIIAHEYGHFMLNHLKESSLTNYQKELEADYFSGRALYILGASVEDALSVMLSDYLSEDSNSTHPSKNDRFIAIQKGWHEEYKKQPNLHKVKYLAEPTYEATVDSTKAGRSQNRQQQQVQGKVITYRVKIFLENQDLFFDEMQAIKSVEYQMDPSIPNFKEIICDKKNGFEKNVPPIFDDIDVKVIIHYIDGEIRTKLLKVRPFHKWKKGVRRRLPGGRSKAA